ncbi:MULTISPECIES: SMEK domain-containing protein [Pectobacterium]|uniref:SMEK domain-containing protein n=1 Tax=Pectobacterium TaxID=122277 RepID=UPI0025A1FA71|nr:SMEK domain-containing protein [Pectobacterium brasiliense]WJM80309.1 SMEK domain-containing protein [Pectobacterium brasiliense]
MLDRQEKFNQLSLAFANFSSYVELNAKAGFFDVHKAIETVLISILNITYNKSYINLNLIKHNHPAVDLGCPLTRTAVQITSDGSSSKVNDAVKKFKEHGLGKSYNSFSFMIITTRSYSVSQNHEKKNLADLANDIFNLDDLRFQQVYDYIKGEFALFWPKENQENSLMMTTSASVEPSQYINDFIKSQMEWAEEEGHSHDKIRGDLVLLKNTLANLSQQERNIIFRVLYQGTSGDYSYSLPWAVLCHNLDNHSIQLLRNVCDSLEHKNMLWVDGDEHPYPVYIRFRTDIEDLDYLKEVADYMRKKGMLENLKNVIIDCDFSFIK